METQKQKTGIIMKILLCILTALTLTSCSQIFELLDNPVVEQKAEEEVLEAEKYLFPNPTILPTQTAMAFV